MTEETIQELRREHDAYILRAREFGEVEIRFRMERTELRRQMEEIIDELRERERDASNARSECNRRADLIARVLRITNSQWN